jgi:hypothetical protein
MVNIASFVSRDEAEKVRGLLLEGKPWNEATSADVTDSAKVTRVTSEPTFLSEAAFDEAFAPMKSDDLGAVSAVFEVSSDDFVVGIKTEAVEEKVSSYTEVSADVRNMLRQQKEREALNAFSQALLGRARIVILDPSLFPSAPSSDAPEVLPVSDADPSPDSGADAVNADESGAGVSADRE